MSKSYLTGINLNANPLMNAKVHVWGSSPASSPNVTPDGTTAVEGMISSYQGTLYVYKGISGSGGAWAALSITSGTVTAVTGTSPVVSSGGNTPAISLASGYGDTLNPYASKSANYILATPNGTTGAPSFRALVSADLPSIGNITNAGAIGSTSGLVAVTTTSGVLTTATNTNQSSSTFLRGDLTWVTPTDTNYYPTAVTMTAGTTAGPLVGLTMNSGSVTSAAIPAAGSGASGVVVTGAQTFDGAKTFTNQATFNGGAVIAAGQTLNMTNNRITNLAEPVSNSDAATKYYVDNVSVGVNAHDAVAGVVAGFTGTYFPGGGTATSVSGNVNTNTLSVTNSGFNIAVGQTVAGSSNIPTGAIVTSASAPNGTGITVTIDKNLTGTLSANPSITFLGADGGTGVGATLTASAVGILKSSDTNSQYSFVAGDRVLLLSQTTSTQNGVYVVTTAGTASVAAVLTRATDYDNSEWGDIAAGDLVYVINGGNGAGTYTYGGTQWVQTTKGIATIGSGANIKYSVLIGTDSPSFTQFSGVNTVPFATTTSVGIASFSSTYFSVNGVGGVSLSSLGALNAASATSATNATNVATTLASSSSTFYPTFVGSTTNGNQAINNATTLSFVPSTGALTAGSLIAGTLTGVSGTSLDISTPGAATSSNVTIKTGASSATASGTITIATGTTSQTGGTSGALTLNTGTGGGTANSSGAITIQTGNGSGTSGSSGNVTIDSGSQNGSGTSGTIYLGNNYSPTISIGRTSGTTTTIYGAVQMPQVGTSGFVKAGASGALSTSTIAYGDLPTTSLTAVTTTGIARKTTASATTGAGTTITVNHGFGQWVHAQLFDASGNLVEVDIQNSATSNGTTIFTFAVTQGATTFNYVIIG